MGKKDLQGDAVMLVLRNAALRQPDVIEGLACKGTTIQSATFKVRGKAFLFLRPGRVMVKLDGSRSEALKHAERNPERYRVGSGGWTTVTYDAPKEVSLPQMERWIRESYGLFAATKAGRGKK